MRDVQRKNHIYEMHISIMLARSLFRNKNASDKEIDNNLIVFERNREGFAALLDSLNVKDGDFILDFKKFGELSHSKKGYYNLTHQQIVEDVNSEYDSEIEEEVV